MRWCADPAPNVIVKYSGIFNMVMVGVLMPQDLANVMNKACVPFHPIASMPFCPGHRILLNTRISLL